MTIYVAFRNLGSTWNAPVITSLFDKISFEHLSIIGLIYSIVFYVASKDILLNLNLGSLISLTGQQIL